ncbi:probable CCR4-associated factor 1 homolog 7 [Phragmites australis]|uniref:probable CCR4-associated factor 1 homolog 7 n=1 Tax=Phragmites australis TaxID=29695 RepID=UPI002D7979E6|nr:probable CCR4-associated factor 1 homolog 7 [Phragmites australis]
MAAPPPAAHSPDGVEIRDVWAGNLEEEFAVIRGVVDAYPYVAMDTEFPGIVVKPVGNFRTFGDHNYAILEGNVNLLKLIQLGLTLSDETGALPPCGTGGRGCIWQFNFRGFDPRSDPSNADSIDLLRRSGIDFDRFAAEGADTARFAELLMSSGVVLNADVQWITFHSGHDFGYLLRLLTGRNMPDTLDEFVELTKIFFPVLYDIKHLMKFCGGGGLYGGLSKLAELLSVKRVGTSHQAGSDSLLTLQCFKKLKDVYLKESVKMYAGVLFGLIPGVGENKPPPLPIE